MVVLLNDCELANRLRQENIDVVILDERRLSLFRILHKLIQTTRSFKPDIIHTHRHKESILGAITARICGNIPSVLTVHGSEEHSFHSPRRRLVTFLDRAVARRCHKAVVTVSRELQQVLSARLHRDVAFIANGVDDRLLQQAPKEQRQRVNPRIRVAFVGRLVPVKRIDIFLQIARQASRRYAGHFEFHVFGAGPELQSATRLVEDLGLADTVTIHGFVAEIGSVLEQIDALLITSDHEGLPMIVLEAASFSIPIIARRVGEIPEVLENGATGSLVDSADPQEFVAVLGRYLEDPEAFGRKAERAKDRVKRKYTASTCASRYRSLYRNIVGKQAKPA